MNDALPPSSSSLPGDAVTPQPLAPLPPADPGRAAARRWALIGALLLAAITLVSLTMVVNLQQRLRTVERELVRRQQDTQTEAAEARVMARQAQDAARDAVAKSTLIEARVSEVALQRSQLEELIHSLSRSRDESLLADIEAAIRVAQQQAAITGSAEPLVATLKQADDRLARYSQPRLERVRHAITRDLERAKAVGVVDVSTLAMRLDEAVRVVDELPLLASADAHRQAASRRDNETAAAKPPAPAASASRARQWGATLDEAWRQFTHRVWEETRTLVRVTRVDVPEAALLAPDQAFFLRENLKLRLLNARLALLSRQIDTAQSDLRDVQQSLERYFDRNAKRVQSTAELVRQVAAQARLVVVPRPDETLAALQAAAAGR